MQLTYKRYSASGFGGVEVHFFDGQTVQAGPYSQYGGRHGFNTFRLTEQALEEFQRILYTARISLVHTDCTIGIIDGSYYEFSLTLNQLSLSTRIHHSTAGTGLEDVFRWLENLAEYASQPLPNAFLEAMVEGPSRKEP